MAEIVNLKRARKERSRAEDDAAAAANRAKFGRTKVEKQVSARETERTGKALDGKRIEPDDKN